MSSQITIFIIEKFSKLKTAARLVDAALNLTPAIIRNKIFN